MKTIKMTDTIDSILKEEPKLLETLIALGFAPLANPISLKTVGKVMTLDKACDHIKLDKNKLKAAFLESGVKIDE